MENVFLSDQETEVIWAVHIYLKFTFVGYVQLK